MVQTEVTAAMPGTLRAVVSAVGSLAVSTGRGVAGILVGEVVGGVVLVRLMIPRTQPINQWTCMGKARIKRIGANNELSAAACLTDGKNNCTMIMV